MCGQSEKSDFIIWKNLRSQMSQKNEGFLELLCQSWFKLVDPLKKFPLLDAPFVSAWNVTMPDSGESRIVRVSCLKWETMCVLTRSILINLSAFLDKPEAEGNQNKLVISIGCAQHAIEELTEWRESGNLKSWERDSDFIPLEVDIAFFEALHGTCRVLYEIYSLSKMDAGEKVLGTGGVMLSLIKRIEAIASHRHVPSTLDYFLKTLVNAIDVGISQTMVREALDCKILPVSKTTWSEIGYWQQRVITTTSGSGVYGIHSSMGFGKSEQTKDAEATLQTISRLDESGDKTFTEPRLETIGFELSFDFPYRVT